MSLKPIDARELQRRLAAGSAVLIDIREPDEHRRERIAGARLVPLTRFDEHRITAAPGCAVVFHCKSGARTRGHAARLLGKGHDALMLEGGLDAWKAAGLPVERDLKAPLELQRQVQIAAGSLVLLGLLLTALISPWFLILSGFVGAGLTFAGITGFCGMARLLNAMPWNRQPVAAGR